MEKYKVCPSCGEQNEPTMLECLICEADLTSTKITDEELERRVTEEVSSPPEETIVRICDCGAHNPPNARRCAQCEEDISDITPVAWVDSPTTPAIQYILSSMDGVCAFQIQESAVTVGRECAFQEYLRTKPYVSRAHAKLSLDRGNLFVENLSSTNYTYVNNQRINEVTQLQNDDELSLGGISRDGSRQSGAAYFLVRIEPCI